MHRSLVRGFLFALAVCAQFQWSDSAKGDLISFETTPAGVAPLDDQPLEAPYFFPGGSVRFFFDANGNNVYNSGVDLNPVFEHIGGDGVNGFRSTYHNGVFDKARPGYEPQLGSFFLRHPGDFGSTDVGSDPFIIDYDTTTSIVALSGEIWDIDRAPAGTEQWRLEVLDAFGAVLASQDSPLGINQNSEDSLDSLPWAFQFKDLPLGVDKLRFTFLGTKMTGLGFALNNFRPTTVPEPATWLLLLIGIPLACLCISRDRACAKTLARSR